ncbi:MAG: hypothetical protein IT212_13220 [Bacteroidia bacterium]|nr:hypothetical protein [Bacteroidia bacterium]
MFNRLYIIEKTSALLESGKQVLTSSTSSQQPTLAPSSTCTDHVSQEAYVTETSAQTAHGPEPATTEQVAPVATKTTKGGPIAAIRNFFSRLFGSSSHKHEEQQRKSDNAIPTSATGQTNESTTTTTTIVTASVATSNPPILS